MSENHLTREYKQEDKAAVLALFRLNTPAYFAVDEEMDLSHYLDHERELYFVVELNGSLVGCGGINFESGKTLGKISWDLLHPDFQKKGIGTMLLQHRIKILKSVVTVKKIMVRTTQQAYLFYGKNGFDLKEVRKDYWAKGFDLYRMEYRDL